MKNKIFKKLAALVMCTAIMLALPLAASARREIVDMEKKGSITFSMSHDGKPVQGGTWTLYRVADIEYDDDGNLIWVKTETFDGYPYDFNTMDLTGDDYGMRAYIESNNIWTGVERYMSNGTVTFDNLTPGLYYICQWHNAPGFYRSGAFYITLPVLEGESYVYDIVAEPKTEIYPDGQIYPTPQPSVTPPSTIHNTGITQWPVPVFAICGLILFVFGWYQFRKGEL
ncbi:MAG: hypothetical protein IJ410_02755 [Oscillospiraceae bacterium]|nr:hypothetical protein [Oscillospiraceae bacterium]